MLFTVIVPIYNVEKYLVRCVDSILAQTFPDFELILVDDGSSDRCPEICDAYAAGDARVRVIHKPNGGLVSARNAGIMAAKGDYICYVDGDDWARPGLLAFVRDRLAESPVPLDMVIFSADRITANGSEPLSHKVAEGYYDRARLEKEIFPYLLSDRRKGFGAGTALQAHTWDKVSRRELQREHYVRDERIRMFTDARTRTPGKRTRRTRATNGEVVVTTSGKSPSASISRRTFETKSASSGEIASSP